MNIDVDFRGGKFTYNEFNLDFNIPLENQIIELQEDLLQVKYEHNYVIDVGWYPELNPNGSFKIYVIKNSDWDAPMYKKNVKIEYVNVELQKAIDKVIALIDKEKA